MRCLSSLSPANFESSDLFISCFIRDTSTAEEGEGKSKQHNKVEYIYVYISLSLSLSLCKYQHYSATASNSTVSKTEEPASHHSSQRIASFERPGLNTRELGDQPDRKQVELCVEHEDGFLNREAGRSEPSPMIRFRDCEDCLQG